jgi:hypothetical protein
MSIGKQIQAFLETSEAFLRQSAVETFNDGWQSVDAARGEHSKQMSLMSAVLSLGATAESTGGSNGQQRGGFIQVIRQDGV